jgi:hypothetical protein
MKFRILRTTVEPERRRGVPKDSHPPATTRI